MVELKVEPKAVVYLKDEMAAQLVALAEEFDREVASLG